MKTIRADINSRILATRNGYGIVETLIVIIIISILVLVVISRYEDILWEARKTALQTGLVNIRQSITLFRITRNRYPKSLNELVATNIIFPHSDPGEAVFKSKYLEHYSVGEKGDILDPFGLPYLYNPATGEVRSQKKGFENW